MGRKGEGEWLPGCAPAGGWGSGPDLAGDLFCKQCFSLLKGKADFAVAPCLTDAACNVCAVVGAFGPYAIGSNNRADIHLCIKHNRVAFTCFV